MSIDPLATAELAMRQTIAAMERDLQKLRVGGASASLVDGIQVDHQGRRARLVELATITIPDARQIVIRPWDPASLRSMGAAISQSRIGLTPTIDGAAIRIYVPAITEERRRELVGLVEKRMDRARAEIRVVRHEALAKMRSPDPDRHVGTDDVRRQAAVLQRVTDEFSAEIDRLGEAKKVSIRRV